MLDFQKQTAEDGFARENIEAIQRWDSAADGFAERGGLLYKGTVLYVSEEELHAKVLKLCHDSPIAGHFGQYKTLF